MIGKHERPASTILVERNGKFFFYEPDHGVIASGSTVDSAFDQFTRTWNARFEQAEQAGIPIEVGRARTLGDKVAVRSDIVGELKIFLAKIAIVLVILAVVGLLAVKAVGGVAEKLASALAPLGSISMVDIANKAEIIVKDVQAMPPERKDALRRSLAILSREVEPLAEAWRNPSPETPAPDRPAQTKP
jgi:hypothetical protein